MSLTSLDSVEVKCPSPVVIFQKDQSSEGTQTREIQPFVTPKPIQTPMIRQSEKDAEEMNTIISVIKEIEDEIHQLVDDFKIRNQITMGISRQNTVQHNIDDLDISGYQRLMQSVSMSDSIIPQPEADSQLFASQEYLESIIDRKIDTELERVQTSIENDLSMEESLRKMEQTLALLLHTSQMRPLYAK